MTRARRLGTPRPATIDAERGVPKRVAGRRVDSVLEDWVVEDRWWSARPVRRRYLELVLDGGRCVLVFRDLDSGRWYTQRG